MSHEENQDLNELKKVRLEKLAELKDMGIDPFGSALKERSAMARGSSYSICVMRRSRQ